MEESYYEKNCFHNMLMERSAAQPTYPSTGYPEHMKSDEFSGHVEEDSSDLKMEHDMYHNDTY